MEMWRFGRWHSEMDFMGTFLGVYCFCLPSTHCIFQHQKPSFLWESSTFRPYGLVGDKPNHQPDLGPLHILRSLTTEMVSEMNMQPRPGPHELTPRLCCKFWEIGAHFLLELLRYKSGRRGWPLFYPFRKACLRKTAQRKADPESGENRMTDNNM